MIGGLPRLRTVNVEGPYNVKGVSNTPSRERLFVCRPGVGRPKKRRAPTKILTNLARRAYRRPVTAADVEAPLDFYKQARENGGNFDAGIRVGRRAHPVQPVVPLPDRTRPGRRPARRRAHGQRCGAGVAPVVLPLEQHPRREAAGPGRGRPAPRARRARGAGAAHDRGRARRCARQQLHRPVAAAAQPGVEGRARPADVPGFRRQHPRRHSAARPRCFFGYILRENRSALELLSADYTFLNERLAKHYGIPGVYGERFRQVKLTDPNRRGLLGQGSILSLTAVATRTSPVFRGKFVLTTFLNTPPPPPPPNVPTLEESNKGATTAPKTVREQLELHRQNAAVRLVPSRSSIRRALRSRTSTRSGSGARRRPMARRSTPPACWRTARRSMGPSRCGRPS